MPHKMGIWGNSRIHAHELYEWHILTPFYEFLREFLRRHAAEMIDENGEVVYFPVLKVNAYWIPQELSTVYNQVLKKNDKRGGSLVQILSSARLPYDIAKLVENNPHSFLPTKLNFDIDDLPIGVPNDGRRRMVFWLNGMPVTLLDLETLYPGISHMQFTDALAVLMDIGNPTDIARVHVEVRVDLRPPLESNFLSAFEEYSESITEYQEWRLHHNTLQVCEDRVNSQVKLQKLRLKAIEAHNHFSMISKLSQS